MVRVDTEPPTPAKVAARIKRGKKWYRLVDGNLIKSVADDPEKMVDVNHYLDSLKPKKVEKPEEETKSKKEKK